MALETLKNFKSIGGFDVVCMEELQKNYPEKFTPFGEIDKEWFETEIKPGKFIFLRHDNNFIAFNIQKGPIKEVGVNGCQVDTLIETVKLILEGLNQNYPCSENAIAITMLDEAILWLNKRKADREKRGVEGFNKP